MDKSTDARPGRQPRDTQTQRHAPTGQLWVATGLITAFLIDLAPEQYQTKKSVTDLQRWVAGRLRH